MVGQRVRSWLLGRDRQELSCYGPHGRALDLHTDVHGVCMSGGHPPALPPPSRPPLTFRSMSRTHLCTRWLVQTTGSVFWVSHRARRSWRALQG